MLVIRGILGCLFQISLLASALLIPAGTWYWPRAIQFIVGYGLVLLVSTLLLARFAPSSLESRLQLPISEKQPKSDRLVSKFLFLSLLVWLVSIPIEVFYLRLLPSPSFMVSLCGAVILFIGYGLIVLAIYQNAFAAPIVKEQSERGHILIDTGLYAHIRHPLYTGLLFYLLGLALWLESYLSVFLLPFVFMALFARIMVEEKALCETLSGYPQYLLRVPYRLIPYIW